MIKPLKEVDNVKVLSIEDIYLRKIFSITGSVKSRDIIGREITIGGRQEAKDFFDLYCLSSITTPLSAFVERFKDAAIKEGIINWYRTYDRMNIKTGLLDLVTEQKIDFRIIDNHFKKEVDLLITREIED